MWDWDKGPRRQPRGPKKEKVAIRIVDGRIVHFDQEEFRKQYPYIKSGLELLEKIDRLE